MSACSSAGLPVASNWKSRYSRKSVRSMLGSCIRTASPKIGWWESSSIIFSALRIDPVNSNETWLAPELISAERMIDSGSPGAVPEPLELVEHDHEVLRERAQRGQLRVQRSPRPGRA